MPAITKGGRADTQCSKTLDAIAVAKSTHARLRQPAIDINSALQLAFLKKRRHATTANTRPIENDNVNPAAKGDRN
jgi:hypothetical protein